MVVRETAPVWGVIFIMNGTFINIIINAMVLILKLAAVQTKVTVFEPEQTFYASRYPL